MIQLNLMNTLRFVEQHTYHNISPSIHMVPTHSAEFFENKDLRGCLNFMEFPIEAHNKFLVQY